ncbi:MAG: hypothetical protein IJW82_04895 [Clostridia bacterium]|nr:hypothetical protein [Clostridia bacterium]
MINTETLLKKSNVKYKNEEIFKNFVTTQYDCSLPSLSGKLYHTLRVTKNCEELATKLNLDQKYGVDIGLLHDFARFEQWKQFGTFVDRYSVDHADMGVDMLFDQNLIDMFNISNQEKPIIYYSVKFHNKANIDYDYIKNTIKDESIFKITKIEKCPLNFDEIILYCKISRDGDKIDLLNRIIAGEMKVSSTNDGYTPECLNRILDKQFVYLKDINTKLDRLFCFIGFLFDINFGQSFSLFSLEDFFKSLIINYGKNLNKEDLEFLKLIINKSKNNLIEKYSLNDFILELNN